MSARWGTCDYKQLQQLRDSLSQFERADLQAFCAKVSKELAARLLAKVIKRTPVGQYPAKSGKVGGTLRRGWTGEQDKNAAAYAQSLPIEFSGDTYTITIINPTEYASFVEFGHRTRGGKGWVQGKFMLTKSEAELESEAPKIIEQKLLQVLKDKLK